VSERAEGPEVAAGAAGTEAGGIGGVDMEGG